MPILQCVCLICEKEFEVIYNGMVDPEIICPTCGSIQTRRIFYPPNIIYKSEGFTKGNYHDKDKEER